MSYTQWSHNFGPRYEVDGLACRTHSCPMQRIVDTRHKARLTCDGSWGPGTEFRIIRDGLLRGHAAGGRDKVTC